MLITAKVVNFLIDAYTLYRYITKEYNGKLTTQVCKTTATYSTSPALKFPARKSDIIGIAKAPIKTANGIISMSVEERPKLICLRSRGIFFFADESLISVNIVLESETAITP